MISEMPCIWICAQLYLTMVSSSARRFDLTPRLVMAVESSGPHYNPKIVSHAHVGLMKISLKNTSQGVCQFLHDDKYLFLIGDILI